MDKSNRLNPLAICVGIPLGMLFCVLPIGYLILGLDYFPWWYRPSAMVLLLGYALRAMFCAKWTQFHCMSFLTVGTPLAIGMLSQFSKEFAEPGAQVAATFVVMAGIVIAPFLYVAERLRQMRSARRGAE
jgi:hypothetical protein